MAAVFRIENRLGIQAPASAIWRVISDLPGWAAWNPLYTRASGQLRIGTELTLTEQVAGQDPQVITPTVVDWVPDAQILWKMSGGFIRRFRYLEIDKLTDDGCVFTNGEDWWGLGARFVTADRRRAMRRAFEAMGVAVRDRAVALWRAEGGTPTSGS